MSDRRQLLLSQLKSNLDMVSRAIGLDKGKSSPAERPAEPARFELDVPSSIYSYSGKGHDFRANEVDLRSEKAPPFPVEHYSRSAATNNGSAVVHDNIHEHQPSYSHRYSMHPERPKLFPISADDVESEDAFLYGTGLSEPKSHPQTSDFMGNSSGQGAGKDLMEKISYLLYGSSSAKKLPVKVDEMQSDQFCQKGYPRTSVASDTYNDARRIELPPSSAGLQDSDETVDRILKTIGLDGRISDVVQGVIRKDSHSARSSQALTQPKVTSSADLKFLPNQMPPITTNSSSDQVNWDRATQQFLNKIASASMGEVSRGPEIPFASPYPPPPNWNSQRETKMPDSSVGLETRLYFKAKPEGSALPGLNYRQNDSSLARALNDTHSNIKALEEALANLSQSKTSLMLRPSGSQRDSMMLENMRMQEELSGQILVLRDTARDLSQQLNIQTSSASIQQTDNFMKNSPTILPPQPNEEPSRESSISKHSNRTSTDRKSRSRSHSRDTKKHRSRSRSRDRKRTHSRRHSRSRSRDSYRHRNRYRSRSRERRRSRDRTLSDADRKALGFGTTARKPQDTRTLAEKAEDKEKKALELALSMYMGASEYYNGTNVWCQKCDVIFSDIFALCQHLHSEMHQSKVDPDYNKPRLPNVPVIPPSVPSAPSRGYEFVLPLQAFFCSLCCEFSKDISKAEEHVKSVEHNKKFKQFLNDNSGYELKFLKDVMMAIARSKVSQEPEVGELNASAGVTDTKKSSTGFLNPQDYSKHETREKYQIKFTGTQRQGNSKVMSKSPDVEIVKVLPISKNDALEDTEATATSTSPSSNVIISKMTGLAKKQSEKFELPRPSGWVLRADAHVTPVTSSFPRNFTANSAPLSSKPSLQNDKPRGPTLDIFSPDSPKTGSTPFSKLPPLPRGGNVNEGKLQTASTKTITTTTTSGTGSAKVSEEAVLNIGDFEIFDEC